MQVPVTSPTIESGGHAAPAWCRRLQSLATASTPERPNVLSFIVLEASEQSGARSSFRGISQRSRFGGPLTFCAGHLQVSHLLILRTYATPGKRLSLNLKNIPLPAQAEHTSLGTSASTGLSGLVCTKFSCRFASRNVLSVHT